MENRDGRLLQEIKLEHCKSNSRGLAYFEIYRYTDTREMEQVPLCSLHPVVTALSGISFN